MQKVGFYDKQRVAKQDLNDLQDYVEAATVADTVAKFFGDNVLVKGYEVTAVTPAAMQVQVGLATASSGSPDSGIVNSKMAKLRAAATLDVAAADPTNPRIDLVVLYWQQLQQDPVTAPDGSTVYTRLDDDSNLQIVTGTPAASPVAPAVPAGGMALAEIAVAAGATSIAAGNITDRRAFIADFNEITTARGTRVQLDDRLSQSLDDNGDLLADKATDTVVGNRMANPATAPSTNGPGTLTSWLSWIVNRIKAITGTTNWYDAPATTLAAADSRITTAQSAADAAQTSADGKVAKAGDAMSGNLTMQASQAGGAAQTPDLAFQAWTGLVAKSFFVFADDAGTLRFVNDADQVLATLPQDGNAEIDGTLTIQSAGAPGVEQALRLKDPGTGASEGPYIRWDNGDKTDQARLGIVSNAIGAGSDLVAFTNPADSGAPNEAWRSHANGDFQVPGRLIGDTGLYGPMFNTGIVSGKDFSLALPAGWGSAILVLGIKTVPAQAGIVVDAIHLEANTYTGAGPFTVQAYATYVNTGNGTTYDYSIFGTYTLIRTS